VTTIIELDRRAPHTHSHYLLLLQHGMMLATGSEAGRAVGRRQAVLLTRMDLMQCFSATARGVVLKRSGGRLKQDLDRDFLNNLGLHTCCTEIILHCVSVSNQLQQWTNNFCGLVQREVSLTLLHRWSDLYSFYFLYFFMCCKRAHDFSNQLWWYV